MTDKLTIEDLQKVAFGSSDPLIRTMGYQLADTMRENERLRDALTKLRDQRPLDGETTLGIIEKALSYKESDNG